MENEAQQVIPSVKLLPQNQTLAPTPPSTNWSNIFLFTLLGLLVITGSILAGIQIGKNQTTTEQSGVIQETISPSPTVDSTANWKTYTNELMKYYFTYPSDWKIEHVGADEGVNIALVDENGNKALYIVTTTNEDKLSLENSYKAKSCFEVSCIPLLDLDVKIINKSIGKIGNQEVLTLNVQTQNKTHKYYFVENVNVITMFEILTFDDKSLQKIDQILSTFKFIQVTQTKTLDGGWIKKSETRYENANGCLWFDITKVDSTQNLDNYLKNYFQTTNLAGFLNKKQYDVAGYDSKTISSQGIGELFSIFLKRNNQIYSFSFSAAVPEGGSNDFIDMCQTYQKENDINSAINSLSSFL